MTAYLAILLVYAGPPIALLTAVGETVPALIAVTIWALAPFFVLVWAEG